MKCCETAIVTIRLRPGERMLDMEIPTFLPLGQLEERFLETIREMDPLHYSMVSAVEFCKGEQKVIRGNTLAEAGIWDGGLLDAYLSEGA